MTDYIQWLLEEEEDAPTEEGNLEQLRIPRQGRRRLTGRFGIGSRQTEAAGGGAMLSENIRRQSVRETDGGLPGDETPKRETEPDRRLGWRRPIRESFAHAAPAAPGEEARREMQRDRALELYTALQKAGRAERRLAGAGAAAPVLTLPEAPARGGEALSPLELDRCFEREARRYDNGFALL